MIKVLHLSDIHLGSTTHGRINPQTGLNTRLEDFTKALTTCIDRAILEPADLVLFGGDAFPDATPAPLVQQLFATQFRRLADAQIPTVLLVGNHDQHSQGQGGASLAIYRSLAVPGFVVGDRLETHRISTKVGNIQVVTLPWLTRSALLTRNDTDGLSMTEVGNLLIDRLKVVLEGEIRQLDPNIPTILLAHVMVDRATYGAERFLAAGKGFTIPLNLLCREEFDYVALGHVHKHQVLFENPLVVYPGSIERVDFGEEKEEKGYCWIEVKKGNTKFEFCPLQTRPFRTVKVDVTSTDHPQALILAKLAEVDLSEAIARLIYIVKPEQIAQIDHQVLHQSLAKAHNYTIIPEVVSLVNRARLPELNKGEILDPISALKAYLSSRNDLKNYEADLISATHSLLEGNTESFINSMKIDPKNDNQEGDKLEINSKSGQEDQSQRQLTIQL
ncbi:Exodeoxyribonuclease I subunit D [Synechococcus sp. PCC 7502]|uniref:exonuclease subunit SbcD n=1 Tax=Synechococcus sp. PCC 7502 TaxID=1173263 RepID=UPI00029FE803|nr:exonuclease subunit SbcD [Synechococcus sp. PCC 7502]AFY74471.1 Exodeoxyribonuclease I subunit D [Synechococcus sp. PCC 7502]